MRARIPVMAAAIIFVLGVACTPSHFTGTTASALTQTANDCNGDGVVNTQDLQIVVNVVLGTATNACADVNHDGATNTQDVQAMLNIILLPSDVPGTLKWLRTV